MKLDMSREPASQPPPHVAISYSIFLPPPFLFLSISFTCFRFIFLNACSVNAGHRREKKENNRCRTVKQEAWWASQVSHVDSSEPQTIKERFFGYIYPFNLKTHIKKRRRRLFKSGSAR